MSGTSIEFATSAFVRLDWECEHFGFSVAQVPQADLHDAVLVDTLRQARAAGVRLAVWPTGEGREVAAEIIAEFSGRLVDRKARFATARQFARGRRTIRRPTREHSPVHGDDTIGCADGTRHRGRQVFSFQCRPRISAGEVPSDVSPLDRAKRPR